MRIMLCVLLFVIAAGLDYADTLHKLAIERRDGHAAGTWSVTMYLLGLVGLQSVLNVSLWYAVPEVLGLYVGSRLAMRRARARSAAVSSAKLHARDFMSH